MSDAIRCPCGEDHSGSLFWPVVKGLIEAHGETINVTLAGLTYAVPRTWIAFHELKASALEDLAKKYGWTVQSRIKESA